MMYYDSSYRKAFVAALGVHFALILLLASPVSSQHSVMESEHKMTPSPEIVNAVSVNNNEVMQAVNRLKQARELKRQTERAHNQKLALQAELARKARTQEESRLAQIKAETAKIALAKQQLALKKAQEVKQLDALKHQQEAMRREQQQAAKKLEQVREQVAAEKLRAAKAQALQAQAKKLKVEQDRQIKADKAAADKAATAAKEAQQHQAAAAAKQAHAAGEVNKYKAMIVNAISQQWIVPENANRALSSQFSIHLAPNGAVLAVTLIKSSGDPILDRSAQTAIYKASPLPVPHDPQTFNLFREISLTVRPETIHA